MKETAFRWFIGLMFFVQLANSQWVQTNGPEGGYITALAINGTNVFAGTSGEGVCRRPVSEFTSILQKPSVGISYKEPFQILSTSNISSKVIVEFCLPYSQQINLVVYDVTSRKIASLVDNKFESGSHIVTWETRNVPAGCHTIRMKAGAKDYCKSILVYH